MGQRAKLCEMRVSVELASQCPRLDYLIDFPAKGKYTIWMRSWGPHPNGDSIYYGLDMQTNDRSLFHTGDYAVSMLRSISPPHVWPSCYRQSSSAQMTQDTPS